MPTKIRRGKDQKEECFPKNNRFQQKPGADAEKIAVFREDLGNVPYSCGAAQAWRYRA